MRDSPVDAVGAIQVLDLATGGYPDLDRRAIYERLYSRALLLGGRQLPTLRSPGCLHPPGLMSAPRGIRLLDTAAPGDNLVAGSCDRPRAGMVAAGSIV